MALIDIFNNWRVDPFSGVSYEEDLEEVHQILEYDSTPGIYGIISHEVPYFSGEIGDITCVEVANAAGDPLSGGTVYSEVTFSTSPGSDEFRVDYIDDDTDSFFSTARFNFNSSEDTKYVKINYKGIGTTVKSRYQLNQVSVVPTNLGVEGNVEIEDNLEVRNDLKVDNDIYIQSDSLFNLNWLDAALDKQFFSDSNSQVAYTNNGVDGKTCLEITANGTAIDAEYRINDQDTYIRMPEGGTSNIIVRAEKTAAFVTGQVRFQLVAYDKDKALIAVRTFNIGNSQLTTAFKWFNGAMNPFPANTVYIRARILVPAASLAGVVRIDWFYGGDFSLPMDIISDIMSGSTVGHWRPTDQYGFSDEVWLDSTQKIVLSATASNYLITDSGQYKNKIKSLIINLWNSIGYTYYFYEGITGTNIIGYNGVDATSGHQYLGSSAGIFQIKVPVSYFSSSQAGIRAASNIGIPEIFILGFILK